MLILLFAAFIFASVADIMDDRITQRGIAAGVAVEGNTYIDRLFGSNKTTFAQRLMVNFAIISGISLLALVHVLQPAALVGLTVVGIKHLKAYFAWRKLGAK